jgi:hypothetical protein
MAVGMTSYDKVYNALLQTSTCQDMISALQRDMTSVKVESVTWNLVIGEKAEAKAVFHLSGTYGVWPGANLESHRLSVYNFISDELVNKIISLHFGPEKDVKTFNCKREFVKRGGHVNRKNDCGEREKDYQRSFQEFLTSKLSEENAVQMEVATKRLKLEIKEIMETEEFQKGQHEALVGFCKNTITKALMPWHNMEERTLQDAWDQFICTTIMDP